jgi:hypothetical protein
LYQYHVRKYKFPRRKSQGTKETGEKKRIRRKEEDMKPLAGRSIGSGGHAGTIVAIVISCEVAPGVNDARFCL